MRRFLLIRLGMTFFLCSLAACSLFDRPKSKSKLEQKVQAAVAKLPFKLAVTDAVNDGSSLYLRARVDALAAWDPKYVFIRLKGFKSGERQEEVVISLAQAIEQQHPQAQARYVAQTFKHLFLGFTLPSEGLSDYQLELIWGKEASASLAAGVQDELLIVKGVEVLQQRECDTCEAVAILRATLSNTGDQAVTAISLEVGFNQLQSGADKAQGQASALQVVEITDLNLPPNTEQDLEFEVDLRRAEDQSFIPVVKILNYQLDSE